MLQTETIRTEKLSKSYNQKGANPRLVLSDVSVEIHAGEMVAIVGKSGSGKTTLMNLIAGLDRPSSGSIEVGGRVLESMTEDDFAKWRGQNVGVVFQFFQLLPTLTALENVVLAMEFVGQIPLTERHEKARSLLEKVGVADHADKLPSKLSGGEQQRVAIARALANDPRVLIADEPTGSLDSKNAATVMSLFRSLVDHERTIVFVTHDEELAGTADRIIRLADGKIISDDQRRSL